MRGQIPLSNTEPGKPHLLEASSLWGATGGVRRVLSTKQQRLPGLGWRHTVLAPGARGQDHIDCGGIPTPATGGYRLVLRRGPVQRLIEQAKPDIVEAADPYVPAWAVLAAAERMRVPAVAFCHLHLPAMASLLAGGMGTRRGRWAERQARAYLVRLYAHFEMVMAPSLGMVRHLRDWGVKRVVHQPLGVDCGVFQPAASDPAWRHAMCRSLGLAPHTRLLIYTGRFSPEKHLQLLADSVALLGPGHALLTVGSGPRPPVGPGVFVLPPEHDSLKLARLLASCDAYVHAGDLETFGLGVLEAMACGTPVVVSAAGGLGEMGKDAGLQVAHALPRAWADALHSALHDACPRRTLAALTRAREHDWSGILHQMTGRYTRLMSGDRAGLADAAPLARLAPVMPP